ncbi:MAG: hypothetical protein HQL80_05895 [Magnetococcales bacterium]|nr:hypothetical protein [Magnetococcales bacterium]
MKIIKITKTGTGSLLLPYCVLLLALLLGCSKGPTELSDLDVRNGIAYVKGTSVPYDGHVVVYFPVDPKEQEQKAKPRIAQEGNYLKGRKEGTWITYSWNGETEEIPYENGKRHGLAKWRYPDQSVKREQQYAADMMHGGGFEYDMKGNITHNVFYDRNRLIPTPPNRRDGIDKLDSADAQKGPGFFGKMIQAIKEYFL